MPVCTSCGLDSPEVYHGLLQSDCPAPTCALYRAPKGGPGYARGRFVEDAPGVVKWVPHRPPTPAPGFHVTNHVVPVPLKVGDYVRPLAWLAGVYPDRRLGVVHAANPNGHIDVCWDVGITADCHWDHQIERLPVQIGDRVREKRQGVVWPGVVDFIFWDAPTRQVMVRAVHPHGGFLTDIGNVELVP